MLLVFLNASENNIILDDNLDPTIDKISHATTSFGLYYTFRYFKNSEFKSAFFSFLISCSYEVYQIYDPFEEEYFRGLSLHDIVYNISGILIANVIDKVLTKPIIIKFERKRVNLNILNNGIYY